MKKARISIEGGNSTSSQRPWRFKNRLDDDVDEFTANCVIRGQAGDHVHDRPVSEFPTRRSWKRCRNFLADLSLARNQLTARPVLGRVLFSSKVWIS